MTREPQPSPAPGEADRPTLEELYRALTWAVGPEAGLRPLRGLPMAPLGRDRFHSLFFSARCTCGTAAVLSVEVARDKSRQEVRRALPALAGHLRKRAEAFYAMSCDAHRRLRRGPWADGPADEDGP